MSVIVFDGDEGEFERWRDSHSRGYVINILRSLDTRDARLHCADCESINASMTRYVGGDYVKVCADRKAELDDWATGKFGSTISTCGNCFRF